jgi:hypothetical protein
MDVLEHQQQRPPLGCQPAQQRQQPLIQLARRRTGWDRLAHVAQGGDDRGVRDRVAAELHALAVRHQEAERPRAGFCLQRQPSLADARLAAQERHRRHPGMRRGQRAAQRLQRLRPPDDHLTGQRPAQQRRSSPPERANARPAAALRPLAE